jgi:hypothetical protein
MAELVNPDEDYYDHLPDGTILGRIPFDDAEKFITLCAERMTPENFATFVREFVRLCAQKHPDEMLKILNS